MSWVYAALPALNLFFSGAQIPCKVGWQPPGWVFGVAWTSLAVTTGGSGALLYTVNDDLANAFFLILCFMLGPGWAASVEKCNSFITAASVYATLIAALVLFIRTMYLRVHSSKARTEAAISSWLLLPLVGWLTFALGLSLQFLWRRS